MYKIQKDMPLPKITRSGSGRARKYPFADMEVGDGFFAPGVKRASLSTHMSRVSKALGYEFHARGCTMRKDKSGDWVEASTQDPGAVAGIAVKRMA